MERNIQELTEKMLREGVERGQAEAERIVDEAKQKAAAIVENAKREAEEMNDAAQKKAAELDAHTRSELKLFAGQTVNALKSEIATLVSDKVVKEAAAAVTSDKEVMGQFIVALAKNFVQNEPVVIGTADAASLKALFASKAKEVLDKGVTIREVNGQQALFTLSPADGSYKMKFGEEEFENFFKSFLRPQLVDMLF